MDGFGTVVPAGVVGVTGVAACVHAWLLDLCDFLVLQAFLDFEQGLTCRINLWMAGRAHCTVPSRALGAEEVAVNGLLDVSDCLLGLLMVGVRVLLPPVEARLVAPVVQLAVMD